MLVEWEQRPQDVANLLNPAFDGLLLHRALSGYQKESGGAMPLPKLFLVLPFVLHEDTRRRLPAKVTTHLATWLQDERDVVLGFAERAADLTPYTQEGLLFLTNHGLVVIDDTGNCLVGKSRFRNGIGELTKASLEVHDCLKRALFVGRWLALSGSTTTLFSLMGVRP